jgi:Stigma-specific protein, Stig1
MRSSSIVLISLCVLYVSIHAVYGAVEPPQPPPTTSTSVGGLLSQAWSRGSRVIGQATRAGYNQLQQGGGIGGAISAGVNAGTKEFQRQAGLQRAGVTPQQADNIVANAMANVGKTQLQGAANQAITKAKNDQIVAGAMTNVAQAQLAGAANVAVCQAKGMALCYPNCADLKTDSKNCGKCGLACAVGLSCVQSKCIPPPPAATGASTDQIQAQAQARALTQAQASAATPPAPQPPAAAAVQQQKLLQIKQQQAIAAKKQQQLAAKQIK